MHMNSKKLSLDVRNTQTKACSTPEPQIDSPTLDNDSICDSETASPIPFMCTQDDADVVYNFYTPKSESVRTQLKGTTPVSRKTKKTARSHIEKRKIIRPSHQRNKLLQELRELNQNVHELVKKSTKDSIEKPQSDEDIFSDTSDSSPRGGVGIKKRCLRKNVLSSKFMKQEPESGLDSDDSINEHLIQVSQAVEDKFYHEPTLQTFNKQNEKRSSENYFDQDSVDDILSNIKVESPHVKKLKNCDASKFENDSFDSLLGNLNDSILDNLTQMPVNANLDAKNDNTFSNSFVRHNSMPVSPSVSNNKPSTSGMTFGRFKSMPFNTSSEDAQDGTSMKYIQDEIEKRRQQAREKLLAKGMLPSHQQSLPILPSQKNQTVRNSNTNVQVANRQNNVIDKNRNLTSKKTSSDADIKLLIEKKDKKR